ncbi:MAG: cobalamin-dependent protein [Smithellaceae bacterium]|nr:cobalamin-dependent protein [Smithellaceae bacterium]
METHKKIRVLIAKIGLDGHDVGAKVLIFWLRDQGMEVIYTGLRQSVEQVVETAIQEAVDVIGVSVLSGSHLPIARKLLKRIQERTLDDVLLLFGGTIPREDVTELKRLGVQGVFPSHAKLEEISAFIRQNVHKAGENNG